MANTEPEHVGRDPLQRVRREPLDERLQPAVALEDEEGVVVPAVLADEAGPSGGGSRGKRRGDSREHAPADPQGVAFRRHGEPEVEHVVHN